jgi:uncharacterized protein YbjT (DUF2867 family)
MRVVVVGGAGNFGGRIVRALRGDPNIELVVAGRRSVSVPGAEEVPSALIDGAGFARAVKAARLLGWAMGYRLSVENSAAGLDV